MTLRLLAVHAHPDDESSKGAGTYAYYRSLGAQVMIVSCTGGERGDLLNDDLRGLPLADRDLSGLRRQEMAAAQQVLGIQHRWLGYQDSGMANEDGTVPANSFADIPVETSVQPLVKLVREFRPHVMITYDENGGYPHPDHIRCHEVSVAALAAAADPAYMPELGAPWQIDKLYYDRMFSFERADAVYQIAAKRYPDTEFLAMVTEMRDRMGGRPGQVTTRVPVGEFLDVRDHALRSHASQVPPDSLWFFWPDGLQQEAWPYEDFQLIESKVTTTMPETDLFHGIEDHE